MKIALSLDGFDALSRRLAFQAAARAEAALHVVPPRVVVREDGGEWPALGAEAWPGALRAATPRDLRA